MLATHATVTRPRPGRNADPREPHLLRGGALPLKGLRNPARMISADRRRPHRDRAPRPLSLRTATPVRLSLRLALMRRSSHAPWLRHRKGPSPALSSRTGKRSLIHRGRYLPEPLASHACWLKGVSGMAANRKPMSPEPDDSLTEPTQVPPPTGVRLRTVIVAVIVSSLVSIGAAVAISASRRRRRIPTTSTSPV